MADSGQDPGMKKVSLSAILEQKKASQALIASIQQTSSVAELEKPKRKLPATVRSTAGGRTGAPQQSLQQPHQAGGATQPPPAQAPQTAVDAHTQQHPQHPHGPMCSRTQDMPTSQGAGTADNSAGEPAPRQKQSLAAKLQELQQNPAASAAAAALAASQQQQQQQRTPPSLKILTQPNWDRRSRAFRALDALAGKSQAGLSGTSGTGQGLSLQPSGQQGSSRSAGLYLSGSGSGSGSGWERSATGAAAAAWGGQDWPRAPRGAATTLGGVSVTAGRGKADEEQWDRDLADKAADMLWDSDDDKQQQQQQQQTRKRARRQTSNNPTAQDSGHHTAAADRSGPGNSSRAPKRQRSGSAASAAAAPRLVPDGIRDALLAEDAAMPLVPAVGALGAACGSTTGLALGLGSGFRDEDQGPPAEPLELVDPKTGLHLQVPGSINQHLRSYQREGVQFLFRMYCKGRGGVLSDDMGLGKTVQAIAFLAALLGKTGTMSDALPRSFASLRRSQHEQQQQQQQHGEPEQQQRPLIATDAAVEVRWPVLVVAPTSVLDNWVREFNMWGHFKVAKYASNNASHIQEQADLGTLEVVLTSYDQLRINTDDILGIDPHVVIFDEAHRLKNSKSRVYEAVKKGLKTKFRYGLSGTIMPNNHEELWSVLDILVPGCLGDYKEYSEYYGKPIRKGQSRTAKQWEIRKGAERLSQLQDLLQKVYLRRTKAIIADQLPKKKDNIVFCQLEPLQYRAYDRTLASPDVQVLQRSRELCDCGSGLMRGQCCYDTVPPEAGGVMWPHYHLCHCSDPDCKRHRPEGCAEYYRQQGKDNVRIVCPNCLMLPAISLLQKISNHLDLIRPDAKLAEQDEQQFAYQLKLAQMVLGNDASALGGLVSNSGGWLGASDETHCGKMATLQALLAKWSCETSQHNKVLVFSNSTRVLDLLEKFVQRVGYDYVRLDGSTAQKQRQALVDEFNLRPSIFLFLMSTVAGGVGLNLTAANKVVVFDPSWNPSNDLQAQDRAYRLGQTRDVEVYRLVGTGTLEELVYRRQIYKQQQSNMVLENKQEARYFEGVQGDKDKQGELWGLQNLLRFSGHTIETRDILNAYQEGSTERQRLERQLQQQMERVQQGQQPGAAVDDAEASAGTIADAAAAAAAVGPGIKRSSAGYQIVEVGNLGQAANDPDQDNTAAAAAPTMINEVPEIDQLQQEAPEFLDHYDAAAVTAITAVGTPIRKSGQQHKGRLNRKAAKQAQNYQAAEGPLNADTADSEFEDSDGDLQQQQQRSRHGHRQHVLQDSDSDADADMADQTTAVAEHQGDLQQAPEAANAAGTQVPDSLMLALQHEGVVLHMHTHDSILGKGQKVTRRRQATVSEDISEHQQQLPGESSRHTKLDPAVTTVTANSAAENQDPRLAAAAKVSAAALAAAKAAADQGSSAAASLAVWQQMPVAEVARVMLQLNAQERKQLVMMYAADMARHP